jgi:hypothetical protein
LLGGGSNSKHSISGTVEGFAATLGPDHAFGVGSYGRISSESLSVSIITLAAIVLLTMVLLQKVKVFTEPFILVNYNMHLIIQLKKPLEIQMVYKAMPHLHANSINMRIPKSSGHIIFRITICIIAV